MNVKFSTLLPVVAFLLFSPFTYAQTNPEEIAQEKTMAFVEEAKKYIETHGKDPAFIAFNREGGVFARINQYIFAISYNGILLANANAPKLLGKDISNLKDENGKPIAQELIAKAKAGGGWVKYRYLNPTNKKVDCKNSYVLPMDNQYLIGSGYYYPANEDGQC